MAYLSKESIINIFTTIFNEYSNVKTIFIGNIPDKNKSENFYKKRGITEFDLDDHESAIGIWWEPDELIKLLENIGYDATICYMDDKFYGAEYRYDLLLKK